MQSQAATPVRYDPAVETLQPGEPETIEAIIWAMRSIMAKTLERDGQARRPSHAKCHGVLAGTLSVLDGLEAPLAQGLFALPRNYDVIARLAHVPGEILKDAGGPSGPRGMSLKIFGVEGEKLPGHEGRSTQDFVLDTGKVFPASDARTFLGVIRGLDAATRAPEGLKAAVSATARGAHAVLSAAGVESANLDFFGHPAFHPLAEPYFSQAPLRYGDYIARLGVFPASRPLEEIAGQTMPLGEDPDALRHMVEAYMEARPAEYEIRVQLCTSLERMPIEDAHAAWDEAESPFRPVARLLFPPQSPPSAQRWSHVEDALSFSPAHSLEAHRPLGSVMRARLRAYPLIAADRRRAQNASLEEPDGLDDIPA